MSIKVYLLLMAICVFSFGCETPKTENALTSQNKVEGTQYQANNAVVNNTNNQPRENSNRVTNAEATPNTDKADFVGTSGITDKKNEIKGVAVLKELRTAQHGDYDRVVFEFQGEKLPGYHIEYIDKPVRACGSGNVVPLKGDGWLEIRFTPAAAHTEAGEPTVRNREQVPDFKTIKEIKSTCDFEAEVEWVLGVASPNKYRVMELKNPTRLAVDIKH